MRELYPQIEPYKTQRIAVDGLHTLFVEECGNPDGLPVIFLHGGPGAGVSPYHRRFFDPRRYRIVLFDQRGAGRSTPFAELRDNTTWHLVADIETIREALGIERWVVFGGSWGSTLALAYAQAHPERALGLVLRGIWLVRDEEIRWFNELGGGAAFVRPVEWNRYLAHIPEAERGDMVEAYWRRLDDADPQVRLSAALAWDAWESSCIALADTPYDPADAGTQESAISKARAEVHYFRHRAFLEPGQLLRDVDKIRRIPSTIVHGRYDLICPVKNAYDLAEAWPEADFHVVTAGHAAYETEIVDVLVRATDGLADRYAA
ncbi:prolyl aminopeptidase [Dyella sp. LX-66]|uniref:prolyl aminopeptidase n=1 Tax=unclassified Dyella TaxID=2634549 RepID=UPI001BE07ED7|nr:MULTISPECIES: prolyl aminopeptidase [unclassified Dyella]MBT2116443.1 prolyl aminopeptidase [Dyella sp. LX-1]MBT2140614.1 prolyl aminopeptidase [Dyella sp. LX-66]